MEREPEGATPSPGGAGEPTPEQQALRAIRNVTDGADPGAEAFALSNAYTDRQLARLRVAWRRLRGERPPVRDVE